MGTGRTYSINDFAQGRFPAHGSVETLTSENRTVSVIEGPFNLEAVQALNCARTEQLRNSARTDPYVYLTICRRSILTSPEALSEHLAGLQQAFVNNYLAPLAVAWVAEGEVEGFDIMAKRYLQNYAAVGIAMRMFRSPESAEEWLASFFDQPKNAPG